MGNTYMIGNAVRLSVTFKDFSGQYADPTEVTLKVRKQGGSVQNLTPVKDATGFYHYDYVAATAGTYFYRFNGTGDLVSAIESEFNITDTWA